MKIHVLGFLLAVCYSPLALADGPTVSRVLPTNNTSGTGASRNPASDKAQSSHGTISRSIVRAISSADDANNSSNSSANSGRGHSGVASRARSGADGVNNNPIVRRSGVILRPTTADVGGRATIAGTDLQTGSNVANSARTVRSRAATTPLSREDIAAAKERLEQVADLNKSCQEQYNECMDQFCAVVDANQKRCSCSANLNKYSKVEEAVKNANSQLNDVAQRIRYVGLSADEISAIMSETEAEEALSGKKDTSETRNMLTQIENMIKDPKTNSSSYANDASFGLDLNLDFSADGTDLFNLDFLSGNNSNSFSSLRGTDLYNAAKKRCNNVLTQCGNVGATTQQITGNYDLAIDKDCIAYEQGLTKMNDTLKSNVRSANQMLQKARLAVLQNKNQYDAKGCIGALETCMTDDMVCGEDYSKCLDPTKRYIDENGKVVLGQNIANILTFMQEYNNAAIDASYVQSQASSVSLTESGCKNVTVDGEHVGDGACNVKYLMQKIGTGAKATDNGLCRPVLDKCRYYTYRNDKYNPYNDIVINYIQRAMVNIRAAQSKIIADYASSCMIDIANCYNQQVTQINTWSSTAKVDSIYRVMNGACYNIALTCAYAVFAKDSASCPADNTNTCIQSISDMFYQSLLCPDNSTFQIESYTAYTGSNLCKDNNCGDDVTQHGADYRRYVNSNCTCNEGYSVWNGQCVARCGTNEKRNSYGVCGCDTGYERNTTTGVCVASGT